MSEPTKSPDAPPAAAAPARRRRPWTDTVSLLALAAAVTVVAIAATPSLLRLANVPGVGPHPGSGLSRVHPRSGASGPRPIIIDDATGDDGDPVDDLEQLYPDPGNWPDKRDRDTDEDDPGAIAPALPPPDGHGARVGLARKALMLVDRAEAGAQVIGKVRAGEMIMIVKEQGDWALVVHSGSGDVSMGWVQKSDIAVR